MPASIISSLVVSLIATASMLSSVTAQTITRSIVDTGASYTDVGQHTSQCVVAGTPAVAYYDVTAGDLKFARSAAADGSGPWTQVIVDGSGGVNVGLYASLDVISGTPAITYYDATNGDLKFARNSAADGSGTWTIRVVDGGGGTNVGQFTSLEQIDGRPAVSYYDVTNGDLRFAHCLSSDGSGGWGIMLMASSGDQGRYSSLAVVDGKPAMCYLNDSFDYLMYAANSVADGSGSWTVTTVSTLDGRYCSLTSIMGRPVISFHVGTDDDLLCAVGSDALGTGPWTTVTVDSLFAGQHSSIAIIDGKPAISYLDIFSGELKFARATDALGMTWGAPVVLDTNGIVGLYTSLAVVNGCPSVSYYDSSKGDIRLTRNSAADGSGMWSQHTIDAGDTTTATGLYTSLAIVAGRPAAAYFDDKTKELRFARALDANGSAWAPSVRVDGADLAVGQFASLAVVGGLPAISYYESSRGDLKFARNSAADGSGTWTTTTVDTGGTAVVGAYSSLAMVGGRPVISYFNDTTDDLMFARNSAADGSGVWSVSTVLSTDSVGFHSSVAEVGGNPAVCCWNDTTNNIIYARNSAADGSGTWTVTVVAGATLPISLAGPYCSLAMVGGRPAISFYEGWMTGLKFARASTADGTGSWTVTTVDGASNVGQHAELQLIGANPAISYWDDGNGNLKFAYNSSVDGLGTWTLTVVDSAGVVGEHTSLALVNGTPAITYHDATNGDLKFARSGVANGSSSWSAVLVDAGAGGGTTGLNPSIQEVAGLPAITYRDSVTGDLRFARNSAPDGGGIWQTQTVDSVGDVGGDSCLAIVAGTPAVSYRDSTNNDLKFARNSASDGSGTWTVTTVDSVGLAGVSCSLAVVGGVPVIAYRDFDNYLLRITRNSAEDGSGTWTISDVENGRTGGRSLTLAQINGQASIAYYHGDKSHLRYARVEYPVPNMMVEQPAGTVLTSGNSRSFGQVQLGSSAMLWFNMGNTGNAALTELAHSITGTHAAEFTLTTVPASPLAAGGSTTFAVSFQPSSAGQRTALLRFTSNDLNHTPFDIVLSGVGITSLDAWRVQYFGTSANAGSAADDADPDGDGLINALEFAIHGHPWQPTAASQHVLPSGNDLEFHYTRASAAVPLFNFHVEWSDTLLPPWSTSGVTYALLNDNGTTQSMKASLPAGNAGRRFVRLRLEPVSP